MSASMEEEREILAALAAVEGVESLPFDANVSAVRVAEYEASSGATFAALTASRRTSAPSPTPGFEERLEAFVMAKVEAASEGGRASSSSLAADVTAAELRPQRPDDPPRSNRGLLLPFSALAGWTAAAALLAVVLFSSEPSSTAETPTSERATLLAEAPDAVTVPWNAPQDSGLAGDVVWSDTQNEGYMRIRGLDPNDPTESQYQLWIFRGTDPGVEPHPVDGGVFDVDSSGEVVIPIDAKLSVGRAGLFAVTIEEPGGVVVSEREEIVLVAARG